MLAKNGNGRTARLLAKDEEHKEAMKECRKAEKFKAGKPGTDKWAVRVSCFYLTISPPILPLL